MLARALRLCLPGPVIGLVPLAVRGRSGLELRLASSGLLRPLSMLFVPAEGGVVIPRRVGRGQGNKAGLCPDPPKGEPFGNDSGRQARGGFASA